MKSQKNTFRYIVHMRKNHNRITVYTPLQPFFGVAVKCLLKFKAETFAPICCDFIISDYVNQLFPAGLILCALFVRWASTPQPQLKFQFELQIETAKLVNVKRFQDSNRRTNKQNETQIYRFYTET